MKIINTVLKIILCLLMVSPILGVTGIFPPPTPDLYSTQEAFTFIDMLMKGKYITYLIAGIFAVSFGLVVAGRTAFAALLILPITVNIIGFHAFLDGGLLTGGAIMANILFAINLYFLWQYRSVYKVLLAKN